MLSVRVMKREEGEGKEKDETSKGQFDTFSSLSS